MSVLFALFPMSLLFALLYFGVLPIASGTPVPCTASASTNIPLYHLMNNVSINEGGQVSVGALNDANAITIYGGLWHSMCQKGGGNWSHFVSNDGARWFQIADAVDAGAKNSSWDNEGPCDGTLSFPDGRPTIIYGADCAEKASGLSIVGDFPRLGIAFSSASDPYLLSWQKDSVNASFTGLPCSFPGKVWKSQVGDYYNMVCALAGVYPWARYTSTDPTFDSWTLASPSFAQPEGVVHWACAGDMWNPIPGAPPGGPTHMLQGCCGQCFYLGAYDATLEQFNVSEGAVKQWVDIGGGGLPFNPAAHWSATSNYFEEDSRVLWTAWISGAGPVSLRPSVLTVPRELLYDAVASQLIARPIEEIALLRNDTFVENETVPLPPASLIALAVPLGGVGGTVDIVASFSLPEGAAASHFGLAVRAPPTTTVGAGQYVQFFVSAPDATGARNVTVDSLMGYLFNKTDGTPLCGPPPQPCPSNSTIIFANETLDVRILVDKTIVETFIMGGRLAWAHPDEHIAPFYSPNSTSILLFNNGDAAVTAVNVSVFGMDCGWVEGLPAPNVAPVLRKTH